MFLDIIESRLNFVCGNINAPKNMLLYAFQGKFFEQSGSFNARRNLCIASFKSIMRNNF
jgi:hypothetical protein